MSDSNDSPEDTPEFRSPKRCLARSFRLSRDRWKLKAAERLARIKALQVKARDLQVSRDLWKQKALHLQAQLDQLRGAVPPDDGQALDQTPDDGPPAGHTPQAAPPGDCQVPPPPAGAAPTHDAQEVPPSKKARRARR
jgi:hypothetical protein